MKVIKIIQLALLGGLLSLNVSASFAADVTQQYQAAMMKMHQEMQINYTNNADIDFARGMIPHHEGAIAMAEIELRYGKDPNLRAMATNIIKAQRNEIAQLKTWLAQYDKK